jgi:hypothetical protein
MPLWQIRRAMAAAGHASSLTMSTARRLHRHVEWAMERRTGWRDHLRPSVKVAVAELRLVGLSTVEIGRVLTKLVLEHPACTHHDPVNLLTRERRSTTVVNLMLQWAADSGPRDD